MKRLLLVALLLLPVLAFAQTKVAVVTSAGYADVADSVKAESESFLSGEIVIKNYIYQPSQKIAQIDSLLKEVNKNADVIVVIGDVTTGRAAGIKNLKPSISVMSDVAATKGIFDYSVTIDIDYKNELAVFKELYGFDNLKVLASNYAFCSSSMCESIVDAITSHIKVPYKILPISKTDQETLRDIVSKGDTALILRQPQLSAKETKDFLNNLAELGVRTFSFGNYKDAQLGMMAVNSPDREYTKTARTTAMAIGELISGNRDGGVLKVSRTNSLVINMDAANVAKFSPKWDTKRDAELIGEELIGEQKYIGYKQALEKAVKTNEDVAIGQIDLKTAGDMVQMSKSAFRPTVNLSSTFLRINEDRALVARGTAAENRFDVTLSLKQILYSEEVFSLKDRADINEIAQKSIAKQAELDIIQQTAQAYMNVLRAKTFVSITQDNLERNKTNYNLAKNRDLAGAANPAELHRWEATIAMAKADVSNAKNSVKLAMTELARLMGEDIDDSFMLEQLKLDTDVTIYTTLMNAGYKLENMADFEKFKAAILNISLENSVELKALKQAAKAAQRTVLSAERSFYHPTVALSGEYKRYLDKSGKGSDDPMPGYDDSEWSIALNASLPLYEGGRRTAELNIEKAALRKIYHEKSKATKQIKQRMIAALENSKASFNQHLLAQASAKAAERTTEIASDLYAKGAVSITELIDAQNARLTAEMNVASTRFDFMEKLVTVERAYGSYFIFKTDAEDAEFINNINKNMQ